MTICDGHIKIEPTMDRTRGISWFMYGENSQYKYIVSFICLELYCLRWDHHLSFILYDITDECFTPQMSQYRSKVQKKVSMDALHSL